MTNQITALKIPYQAVRLIKEQDVKAFYRLFLFVVFSSIAFLTFSYVSQINHEASENSLLTSLEKKITQLSVENNNLEVNLISAASIEKLTPMIEKMNFEKAENASYVDASKARVAINN